MRYKKVLRQDSLTYLSRLDCQHLALVQFLIQSMIVPYLSPSFFNFEIMHRPVQSMQYLLHGSWLYAFQRDNNNAGVPSGILIL
jgi:hypothetical protein